MKRNNESGYILVGALLIITILAVFGLSLVMLSITSVKTSTAERTNQTVYYVAEAGLNYQISEFRKIVENAYYDENVETDEDFLNKIDDETFVDKQYENFEVIDGVKPFAIIDLTKHPTEDWQYIIKSTGYLDGDSRTVEQVLTIGWEEKFEEVEGEYELPPLAVFTSGSMNLTGVVNGNIGTTSVDKHAIKVGNGRKIINGNVFVPVISDKINAEASELNRNCKTNPVNEYESYSVSRPKWENNSPCPTEISDMWDIPELPPFPIIPNQFVKLPNQQIYKDSKYHNLILNNNLLIENYVTNNFILNMTQNLEFNNINIDKNNTLYINVGNEDRELVVNHLNLLNGHIKLIGNGNLTIYVKDKITTGAGSTINMDGDMNNLDIFYKGTSPLNLTGGQKIYGSLYAEQANISIGSGGGIYGNIFTNGSSVTIKGGASVKSQLILAPNADVYALEGGNVEGRIISKTFDNSGGATITLKEPFVLDGPISPAALGGQGSGGTGGTGSPATKPIEGASPSFVPGKIKEIDE